jgi:hypothetical protein
MNLFQEKQGKGLVHVWEKQGDGSLLLSFQVI